MMTPSTPCYLCQDPTEDSCPDCHLSSCSSHLPSHLLGQACLPFMVKYKEGVGRYVVASRDIKAAEIILEETPAVLGPNYETEAVCLECLSRVDGSDLCYHCNLPLCGDTCREGPKHRPECEVFRELGKKVSVATFGAGTVASEYCCITVLRLLALRDRDHGTWSRVQLLMDHDLERRKEKEFWQISQENVVDYIRSTECMAGTYSEEDIHRAIGILRTNEVQIQHPYLLAQGTSGRAVYPTFSFLSHSCMSNARYSVMPNDKLILRAQVDIKKGEEITIQYISFLLGNSRRRSEIASCWMFECRCPRCLDITEFGSFLSAALCSSCKGAVLPSRILLECNEWECSECGQKMEDFKVGEIVRELEDEMMNIMEDEPDKYQALVEKYSSLLHPNHYQLQILKRHLATSFRGNMTLKKFEQRQNLLEDFIKVFQMVDPGLTKWRGKMFFQVCKTKMFIADKKLSKEDIQKEAFLTEMRESISGLEEVIRCLQYEPVESME